jgi:hypothetical protein
MKDHEIAALVSEVTRVAVEFAGHQSLRQRISDAIRPALELDRAAANEAANAEHDVGWDKGYDTGYDQGVMDTSITAAQW